MERRLAAILAADVVGYSRLMEADEEATVRTLQSYRELIDGLVVDHHGRVFGSAGDSVVADFASPVEAVRCAVEIQRRLDTRNADLSEDRRMRFRMAFIFKGKAVKVQDVARELGVRYVLEGSARRAGSRIRVTAQLIDTTTGHHVWAQRYDRNLGEIFDLQDEITLRIVSELQVELTEGAGARLRYTTTDNLEAWEYWVRGLASFGPEKENLALARIYWEKALELDPESAAINAMLARTHAAEARFGWVESPVRALDRCLVLAHRAADLDPANADAHLALGWAEQLRGDMGAAKGEFETALGVALPWPRSGPGRRDNI